MPHKLLSMLYKAVTVIIISGTIIIAPPHTFPYFQVTGYALHSEADKIP